MPISNALAARLKEIAVVHKNYTTLAGPAEGDVIPDFALFVDTHRDQPHVGSFFNDIHRGFSRPVWVDYEPATDMLIEQSTGVELKRHDKHMFITDDWMSSFLLERMMNGENDPRDADGILATSHLRDARAKVYFLKSFRQIVMDRWMDERANGPRTPRT
jgi:hypothetical protein